MSEVFGVRPSATSSSADSSAIGPAPLLAEGDAHGVAVGAAFDLDRRRVGADVDAAVLEASAHGVTGERLDPAEQPGPRSTIVTDSVPKRARRAIRSRPARRRG